MIRDLVRFEALMVVTMEGFRILCHAVWEMITSVSGEYIASIFRVEEYTTQASETNKQLDWITLKH
jgi:hypothetical protein